MTAISRPAQQQAAPALDGFRLADANINPLTGLSTDYLNHFNEAIMLLEMLPEASECVLDFFAWRPLTYSEHFIASRLKERELAVAAYQSADPKLRQSLDGLASTMTAILTATRDAMRSGLPEPEVVRLAQRAVECLKPLVARAGAVINGGESTTSDTGVAPQDVVDALMER